MSHRVGAVVITERDVWTSFNSCFIFVLRKYIHESTEFVQFHLNSAQFLFFFFWLLLACRHFFFLLRLVLDRDRLVADWILLSAFSLLDWSGKIWSSCFLRLEIVSGSALEFFSCCWIRFCFLADFVERYTELLVGPVGPWPVLETHWTGFPVDEIFKDRQRS